MTLRELEARNQRGLGVFDVGGRTDQSDDGVEVVQRLLESEKDMFLLPSFAE